MTSENYIGAFDAAANAYDLSSYGRHSTHGLAIAANKMGCYPCSATATLNRLPTHNEYYSMDMFIEYLKQRFNYEPSECIRFQTIVMCAHVEGHVIELVKGKIYVQIVKGIKLTNKRMPIMPNWVKLFFRPESNDTVDEILAALKDCKIRKPREHRTIYMIGKCNNELRLYNVKINDPNIVDLDLNYGDGFSAIHTKLSTSLNESNTRGMVLFHGPPGTGKTNYIRYLIHENRNKKIIYFPPYMAEIISSPEFLTFMLKHKDSILIIEDAENIIKSRDGKEMTTQAVANLLNLSDGLLGDALCQIVIATFNCKLTSIDPALLRKGRLLVEHRFDKLCAENAQRLSNRLGFDTKINEPMSLADVYCQTKNSVSS